MSRLVGPRSTGRRIAALILFWLAQFAIIVLASFVVGSIATGLDDGIVGVWDNLTDADGYFDGLLHQQEGLVALPAYAIVATATTLLVAPVVGPLRLSVTGRSLRTSVIGAGILGGLVAFVFVGLVLELPLLYGAGTNFGEWTVRPATLFGSWFIAGAIWTALLWKAGSTRDPMGLDRLLRRLFAATMIEVVLAVPIFLIARKKENCYCSLHSFWGILGGSVILFMLCGPWAVLFLTRSARRGWQREACPACGYPRRTDASVCSECGGSLPPRVAGTGAEGVTDSSSTGAR